MFFKSVVSIQILKQTMNTNVKLGNKTGTVKQSRYRSGVAQRVPGIKVPRFQNWHSTADKIHQVDSCICGYLVHVSTLCLYSFNIKKAHKKYPASPPSLCIHPVLAGGS
jgi:hypothetical protein